MEGKLRVAWFSLLNHTASAGSSSAAYVSDTLLPHLRDTFEIDLFHDSFSAYKDYNTYHYLSCYQKHRANPYNVFFYQLEDTKACNFARMHLGLMPGIVWFHDYFFNTFAPPALAHSPWQEMPQAFARNPKEYRIKRVVLKQIKHEGEPPKTPEEPRALRESNLASVSLFSDERNHAEFLQGGFAAFGAKNFDRSYDSLFLPFPVTVAKTSEQFEPGLIAFSGSLGVEHRAHKLLEALAGIKKPYKLVWLIDKAEESRAKALLSTHAILNYSLEFGRSPERWEEIVSRAELAFHLLFSAFSRQGPYLQISMMAGAPCLISDFGASLHFPSELVVKIEPGNSEAFQLKEAISALLGKDNRSLREATRAYAQECFDSKVIAQELAQVFHNYSSECTDLVKNWDMFMSSASSALVSEVKQTIESEPNLWQSVYAPAFKEFGWPT